MDRKNELIKIDDIKSKIFTGRGMQVMRDSDLAELYQTETKYVNRAVKRNPDRFPDGFVFQLNKTETDSLRFQFGTSRQHTNFPTGKPSGAGGHFAVVLVGDQ